MNFREEEKRIKSHKKSGKSDEWIKGWLRGWRQWDKKKAKQTGEDNA